MSYQQGSDPTLAKLMSMAGDFNSAKVEKDPFGGCNASPGVYFAQLQFAVLKLTQAQDVMVTFQMPLICDDKGNPHYAGEPAQCMHILKPSANQTVKQRLERLCFDIQKFNYDTSAMNGPQDLRAVIDTIHAEHPLVMLSITEKDGRQNINLKGVVLLDDILKVYPGFQPAVYGNDAGGAAGAPVAGSPGPAPYGAPAVAQYTAEEHQAAWEHKPEHDMWYNPLSDEWMTNAGEVLPREGTEQAAGYVDAAPAPAPAPAPVAPARAAPRPPAPAAAAPRPPAPAAPAARPAAPTPPKLVPPRR